MRKLLLLPAASAALAFCSQASAATTYALDLNRPSKPVQRGHLDLGGTGPNGTSIEVNSYFIEQNGKPFIPIVGEFHFCRYPADYWEESLRKMKAGGVNTVASYIFWNLHEREEGKFDWSGDLDVRRFVETARKAGLQVIMRVGPFGHGEIRNGGLPDWLYGRALEIRSNDPAYLKYTERLYGEIGAQLKGLFFKDGGPIIGVQLENEFQHSAAPWEIRYTGSPLEFTAAERDAGVTHGGVSVSEVENRNSDYGRDHMVNLRRIAERAGLIAPLYTATGWGNAAIVPRASIPVTAGYPFPFWSEPRPSPLYLFKDIHAQPDYMPVSYEPELYPSIPAELGAGISPIYRRRPFVPEDSIAPLIVRVLGSGSNGIGYYMYHGGATPAFGGRFYNEDANGLPKINYDYQSPLGEYGQPRSHFHSLNLLHLFLASFGARLAPMQSILPETNAAITPADTRTLRFAARASEGSGFLFIVNYQDHVPTADIAGVQFRIAAGGGTLLLPSRGTMTVRKESSAILPVNLDLGGVLLRSATVQPLTIIRSGGVARHVFFSIDGFPPELVFTRAKVTGLQGCEVREEADSTIVSGTAGKGFSFVVGDQPVLVIPRELALQAAQAADGRLLFAEPAALVIGGDGENVLFSRGQSSVLLQVYPKTGAAPEVAGARLADAAPSQPELAAYRLGFDPVEPTASFRRVTERKYALKFDQPLGALNDVLLQVDYTGDTGMAFVDGGMVDDHFYFGRTWEIGLKRFAGRLAHSEMVFVFHPIRSDAGYLSDIPEEFRPVFEKGASSLLQVRGVHLIPEYKAELRWPDSPPRSTARPAPPAPFDSSK